MEPRKPACILCRGVKLKCVNENDLTQRCQRCRRLDLPCAYSKRRRRVKAGNPKILPAPPAGEPSNAAGQQQGGVERPLPTPQQQPSNAASSSNSTVQTSSSTVPSLGSNPNIHDGQQRQQQMRGPPPAHVPHAMHAPPPHSLPHQQRPPPDWQQYPHPHPPPGPSSVYMPPDSGSNQRTSGISPANPSPLGPGLSPDGMYPPHPPPPNNYPPRPQMQPESSYRQSHGYGPPQEYRQEHGMEHNYGPPPYQDHNRGVKRSSDLARLVDRPLPAPDANELPFMSASSTNPDRTRRSMLDDPIHIGYLNEIEGHRLVDLFHLYLNPMIALLDPQLHTCNYMRDGSSLLFSAVLAASAQFFHKETYPRLLAHAQKLVSAAVEQGNCNIGLVQALLILVYWKQPTDQSAWIKIGMAVRLGYQLGWHLRAAKIPSPELPTGELEQREQLDEERSWFCLAAFDRTYASVFNLPNAIRAHELSDIEQWIADHQHLDIINDLRLACSVETLFFVDGVRTWKQDSKTMSKPHALVQIERLYERGSRLYAKWCLRGEGLTRKLNERERCFLVLYHRSILFGLRVQMLDFVPAAEVEHVLAECLDRAVSYVEALQVVANEGIWQFQQDIASAKLAQFCGTMQDLFWRSSNPQRRIVIGVLREIHQICVKVSDGSPDAPSAFVARFLERLLANLNQESRVSRGASPEKPVQPESFVGSTVPPQVDEPVLADLSEFLDTSAIDPNMAAFDEAYWSALFASFPYNLNDFVTL